MDLHTTIRAPVMLQGANYLLWSRTIKTTLCSKGLWAHITSTCPAAIQREESLGAEAVPAQTEAAETTQSQQAVAVKSEEAEAAKIKWYQEDQMVLSILQNSLAGSLLEAYSYCESAKDLWETLQKVYGNTNNLMRIFEVKKALGELKQEEVEFTKHYGTFRALWAELEMLRPATIDPITLHERKEQDKVFSLLLTLNTNYTELIKHMLRENKLPSLEDVCAKIQKEQGSQELFGNKGDLVAAHKGFYKPPAPEAKKKRPICEHCKRAGHSKKECWVLHPELKPSWWIDRTKPSLPGGSNSSNMVHAGSSLPITQAPAKTTSPVASSSEYVKRSEIEALIKALTSGNVMGKSLHASFQTHAASKPLIVDSGASHHMISDLGLIENLEPALGNVVIANGTQVPIKGIGKLKLFEKESKAFYMPSFTSNLLSVKRATTDLNCHAIFGPNDFYFQDIETSRVFGQGTTRNDLYVLEDLSLNNTLEPCAHSVDINDQAKLWHARLGHPHVRALELILPGIKLQNDICEACVLGKHCKTVFQKSDHTYDNCFDLVHSDVWTSPNMSRENHKYFVTFIDEKSKYTWVTLLCSKDRVLEAFINFQTYVTNQYNAKIKCLRTDNGGEYTSTKFRHHLAHHGIEHQTSCPYTPQQNGVAERKNRHLMEVVRSMMFHMKVPKRFWGDALVAACYLINRTPTKVLDDLSPFQVLNQTKPNIDHLRVFGCVCFVLVPGELRNKLEPKSIKAMFIGYSATQKGYKCYNPETRRVLVSRDVKFVETKGFYEEGDWDQYKDISSNTTDQADNLRRILESFGIVPARTTTEPDPASCLPPAIQISAPTQAPSTPVLPSVTRPSTPLLSSSPVQVPEAVPLQVPEAAPTSPQSPHHLEHEGGESSTHAQGDSEGEEPTLVSASKRPREQPNLVHALEEVEEERPVALRRSTRQRFPPSNWKNTRVYYNHNAVVHHDQGVCNLVSIPANHVAFTVSLDKEQIPKSYEEAMTKKEWREAIQAERQAMEKNQTYAPAVLPQGKKAVSSKWIFTIKYKSNGEIDRYKARLVARGFTQTYGEDYRDTFAPVAKLHSVNVVLSLATNLDWELWQMDVKNAFLQGELEEEVYMTPPPGLESDVGTGNTLRLRKAIYGLKQSPRAWYHKLNVTLRDRGFKRSEVEHTLFTLQSKEGIVVILIYVDDIIISGSDREGIASTKAYLKSVFDIKDLGELKYFLGIEVCRFKEGLFLSQRKYIVDLLTSTGMMEAKPAKTPLEEGYKVEPEGELGNGEFHDVKLYRKVVGKLIYLTITRPDLCFAVNQVSQHMQNPKIRHWEMINRILRYLKGTHEQGIWMGCNGNTEVVGYCDADWAGDREDRRSTTGYCTFIGGNLVTWKTKKQKVVSCSSAEAEYRAMRKLTTECIWLKQLLLDIIGVNLEAPITIHCDNQAAIHIASNSVFHERTKHIEVDCHKVREAIEKGIILPCYTRSGDQLADVFTKATTLKTGASIYPRLGLMSIPQH